MASDETVRDLRETVQQLQTALATTKETVQQLQDALSSREEEIAQVRGMLSRTKKERDELRGWNAELVNRLAVVGRRQSTSSTASPIFNSTAESSVSLNSPITSSPVASPSHPQPSPPHSHSAHARRSIKLDSPLPPLPPPSGKKPPAEDEGSDTEYCDMEKEATDGSNVKRAKIEERRSPSPAHNASTDGTSPQRKLSQPKPIVRNPVKPSSHSAVNLTSPKRNAAIARKNLSSISEEGSPGKDRRREGESDKGRLLSEGSLEGSHVFENSFEASMEGGCSSPHRLRGATMSLAVFKKQQCSQSIDLSSAEAEDVLEAESSGYKRMRSRVSTIASSTGKEYRRKNSKQLKEEAAKLERSQNFRPGGRKFQRLELFSPDMELRIREKICSGIGTKYGGIRRATQAAIVIQTAYRQYKLKKRYEEIRKEAIQMRKRAQTMNHPHRTQSMVRRNRPLRYNRQITALATHDPLLKTRLLSHELGQEGIPHTSSRTHLVQQIRSARSVSRERETETPPPTTTTTEPENKAVEMETVVCEMPMSEVEAVPPLTGVKDDGSTSEATDSNGLPTSFSSDVLLTSEGYGRRLSIFSLRPSASVDTSLASNVTSDEDHVIQVMSQKPLPPDVREKKMKVGIGHFNRKPTRGIQYLVREHVLPDSPQHVATFLSHKDGLSKEKIGEFVGEISSEFHMAVLECLLEQMDMKEKPIDEALREFQILFRMPGEAQKIDKIMQMFALEYFRFNKDGIIKSEDAAYVLAFAIMMLHTSLHNPSVKNRTTKKQWVSMNRGCNDEDNFPEPFLHDIYDRIGKHEFVTGKDHTNIVCEIERNLVGYQNTSRLAVPQRKLVYRTQVTEIDQLTSRPSFKTKRRRIFFLFSDQVIVCKRRGGDQLDYRHSFLLLDAIAVSFETHHYRHGVQILSSHDGRTIFQCNCDSSNERTTLLTVLETTINELRELEKERITELGSTMTKTQEVEPETRKRMTSRAGDLLSSAHLDKTDTIRSRRTSKGDYVTGVGDLVLTSSVSSNTIMRRTSKSSGTASPENRTSGGSHESGYDSQRATPAPSPSPTNPPHTSTPPTITYSSTKRPLKGRQSTTSAPMTLMNPANPVTRSRSQDQINLTRVMTITPTLGREDRARFSSAEDVRVKSGKTTGSHSASGSPRPSKKKDRKGSAEKGKRLTFSSPFHLRRKSRRGSSPTELHSSVNGRPRTVSTTPSPPPPNDLEQSTRSFDGRASAYIVKAT